MSRANCKKNVKVLALHLRRVVDSTRGRVVGPFNSARRCDKCFDNQSSFRYLLRLFSCPTFALKVNFQTVNFARSAA